MNKNTLRTAITTAAIATVIVGIGAGTATARPTAIPDPEPSRVGVLLGSDAIAGPGENWTCTIRQGATTGTENGTGLKVDSHVVINPAVADWQPGPVSGWCVGPQGLQPLAPGAAAG
ncbi:hypothetical protein [Rhodococcus jostii]|uniref:Secreted protein n=1 Tax=Rhodococcus jostii TaxID=132919 RepID=A0A1H4J6K8_RHOJO|nr:hypothetical protein [Rhodococcus jostii]RYE43712.1 MAG: hypothetical protein EOP24_27265 [Hyphomicrobiales bacterium]SEB41930.1 hypothetical protein SAMN04490220_0672 [Rhodococcus jostii]